MLIDTRSLPDGSTIEADLCIIGAGPAGLTVAKWMAGKGLRIAVLESGGPEIEPDINVLTEGGYSGIDVEPLDVTRMRVLGGTSTVWNGQCRPFDALDFERRPWVPNSGWPFDLAELGPFYAMAHTIMRLEPVDYDMARWSDKTGTPLLDVGGEEVFHRVSLVRPLDFWVGYASDLESAEDVAVHVHASVLGIHAASDGLSVERLTVGSLDGRRLTARARSYVLACGGIENARLLLLSNDVHAAGLGNGHDVVGRYFMEHPRFHAGTLLLPGAGMPSKGLYSETYIGEGFSVRGDLGLSAAVQEQEEIGNILGRLQPASRSEPTDGEVAARHIWKELRQGRYPDDLGGNLWTAITDLDAVTVRAWDELFNQSGELVNAFEIESYIEQIPNPESRVTLAEARDAFDQPRAHLRWDLTEFDKRTALRGMELFARELGARDVGRVRIEVEAQDVFPPDTGWGHHHMGTTRMSDDARHGVVDRDCRVHGLSNLHIAGSSVFSTSGCATPTLTLVALALRLAEHLERTLQGVET